MSNVTKKKIKDLEQSNKTLIHDLKEMSRINISYELQMNKYKQGYEECRNILNPEQLRIIENKLKELGIL